jgi:hypothetical protein
MVRAVLPVLRARQAAGASREWLDNVIAATAEGYAFPTDLDVNPPVGGLAPASQADRVRQELGHGAS